MIAQLIAGNDQNSDDPNQRQKIQQVMDITSRELPICKGGCRELSCAYPRMCKQMITQYKCRCAECQDCDEKTVPATNNVVGKEHFKRRVVKAPTRR